MQKIGKQPPPFFPDRKECKADQGQQNLTNTFSGHTPSFFCSSQGTILFSDSTFTFTDKQRPEKKITAPAHVASGRSPGRGGKSLIKWIRPPYSGK